jgi:hypothetical protein
MKTDTHTRLAYTVLDYIEDHPERHDQDTWITVGGGLPTITDRNTRTTVENADCGATCCFAGWAVLLNGDTIASGSLVYNSNGRFVSNIDIYARHLLGLTPDEADELFYGAKDIDDVRRAVAHIYGPRPADLPTPAGV